jgi:glycosyltransferase involved in cell wall biosynthesis
MKISYLITDYFTCGGNRVIFEHCNRLVDRGHDVSIIFKSPRYNKEWFKWNQGVKHFNICKAPKDLDIVVATFWSTVFDLERYSIDAKKFFYFVQSDERRFCDEILGKQEVEKTYRADINMITIAQWIKKMLWKEFGKESIVINNHVNHDEFYPDMDVNLNQLKNITLPIVLIEGSIATKKKGVYDSMEAIEGLDCVKWLVTNSPGILPEISEFFDKIWVDPNQDKLRKIYSTADIIMKTSWFEGSPLVQLEAMACNTTLITSDATGTEEHCIDQYNCLKVPVKDINAIRQAVMRLIEDNSLSRLLRFNGLNYAKKHFNWNRSIDLLEKTFANSLI